MDMDMDINMESENEDENESKEEIINLDEISESETEENLDEISETEEAEDTYLIETEDNDTTGSLLKEVEEVEKLLQKVQNPQSVSFKKNINVDNLGSNVLGTNVDLSLLKVVEFVDGKYFIKPLEKE